jgi:hypothetical protein
MYDDDGYDYNRTVEELACIDNLNKLSKINFNLKCNQFFINKLSKMKDFNNNFLIPKD